MLFIAIGLGFMLIETSQMQRLIIALSHPTYDLSVVLFSLLLSSGLGSYLTSGVSEVAGGPVGRRRLVALVMVLGERSANRASAPYASDGLESTLGSHG